MDNLFETDEDSTPLAEEEKEGLIPSWLTFRHELNAVEQENILLAEQWAFSGRKREILTEKFIRDLHKRMFGKVWKWAGMFRQTARNIGVDAWKIAPDLKTLLDDTRYWIEHHTYPPDEIAARFHHRLVWIHPFPNGNGRMARLMTDVLLTAQLQQPRFSWGSANLVDISQTRQQYVQALRAADDGNIQPLQTFVRS
jgi:Fic-DOC domain mobile mystery protein B